MISQFIDLVKEIFPCISNASVEELKTALKEFSEKQHRVDFFDHCIKDVLTQGDVLSEMNFLSLDEQGNPSKFKSKALVLSNTCACQRETNIIIAPMLSLSEESMETLRISDLQNNLIYRILYFPDKRNYSNFYVDLNRITSVPRKLLFEAMEKEIIKRESSLSLLGYYLLICKLSVYLMRPEDSIINESRYFPSFNLT